MRADREKRAAILQAEGVKQAAILQAEGEKQAAILKAEGQKQSAILAAEGQSQAISTVFAAIHEGKPDQELLAYQYLQMLPQIAQGDANKVWVIPSELTRALGGLGERLLPRPGEDSSDDLTPITRERCCGRSAPSIFSSSVWVSSPRCSSRATSPRRVGRSSTRTRGSWRLRS